MSGRDHSTACALCGYQRGGINKDQCLCDDWVVCNEVPREFADIARAVAEARDEACAIAREWIAMRPPGIDTIADVAKDQLEGLRAVGKVTK